MLPKFIKQELMRRLSLRRAQTLARSVGINPDLTLPEPEVEFFKEYQFAGKVDFDLTVVALGQVFSAPCRLSWTADLADDKDRATGRPIRTLGRAEMHLHALIWTGEETQLEWTLLDERLLPPEAIADLDEQVEAQAQLLELAQSAADVEQGVAATIKRSWPPDRSDA